MVAEARGSTQIVGTRTAGWSAIKVRHLWLLLIVGGAALGPASTPMLAPDVFWSLRRGAWMVEHRALLTVDPLTSAPHVAPPHINVQWLADLVLHGLERLGGPELVIVGTATAVATAYGLILLSAVSASGLLRLSCLTVVAAYVVGVSNLLPRTQTLVYPLFALFVLAIARAEWRSDRRLLWLLPGASAIWANMHGSFPLGLVLLACVALGRRRREYALALGACAAASLLTPFGLGTFESIVSVATNPIIREHVPEWGPTTIRQLEGIVLFSSFVVLVSLALMSRVRMNKGEMLTLIVFGALALASVRGVVWFGFVAAPIAARLFTGLQVPRFEPSRERPLLNLALALAIVAVMAISLPWFKHMVPGLPADKRGLIGSDAPVGAASFLNQMNPPPTGRMFNFERWGGYLDWAVWPRHQAFIDGRFELYPRQVWLDYMAIATPRPSWRLLLDQYEIAYVLLSHADQSELIGLLRQEPGWRVEYEDALSILIVRQAPTGV